MLDIRRKNIRYKKLINEGFQSVLKWVEHGLLVLVCLFS